MPVQQPQDMPNAFESAFNSGGPDQAPVSISGETTEVIRRQPDGTWRYAIDDPFSIL